MARKILVICLLVAEACKEFFHHLINGEAGRFLARRELLECHQKITHDLLSRYQHEGVIDHPIPVGV